MTDIHDFILPQSMMTVNTFLKGGEKMANEGIRAEAKKNGLCLWELADHLHVSEATITRKLRRELGDAERDQFLSAISEIAKEKAGT